MSLSLLLALYTFASPSNLFIYLKRQYSQQVIHELNLALKLKGKCIRAEENIRFLRKCLTWYVTPTRIRQRVRAARPKAPVGIERAFIKDEINKDTDLYKFASCEYRSALVRIGRKLSFFDWLRFCKFINGTSSVQRNRLVEKKKRTFEWLNTTQNGELHLQHENIVNLADIVLTDAEKDVLCRGLKFGIPPSIHKESIYAEFELAWQQIAKTKLPKDNELECKATLSSLAHRFANSRMDRTGFRLNREHNNAIKNLKKRSDVIITKPDKGNGVVLLERSDYVDKMEMILNDASKFLSIGPADVNDRTVQIERALQAFLLQAKKRGHLTGEVYERIRPVGSVRPRMYGLPKLHKNGVPLRPILSMVGAPQHELGKWLVEVLQPVLDKYSSYLLKDTFAFCDHLEDFSAQSQHDIESLCMCSFDVVSLFTNVPLQETIDVCMDALYRDESITAPLVPEDLVKKLLLKATADVEFSFNGQLYRQIDGVAMGSPLGPILANIFVGHLEASIPVDEMPKLYDRFVDDTFSVFVDKGEADIFFSRLNGLHPNLRFTVEFERYGKLPFMDVLVEKSGGELTRSVYRKPTFTGLYTRWDSFCPMSHKTNLIRTLTGRAVRICSQATLENELDVLRSIFRQNGYPLGVVEKVMSSVKLCRTGIENSERSDNLQLTQRVPVVLRLPWIGAVSNQFRREFENAVVKADVSLRPVVVFTTRHVFNGRCKDVLPMTSRSCVIYSYKCCCEQQYIGKTVQILSERIKQHVPSKLNARVGANDSAVTKHLKERPLCIPENPASRFKILARARNRSHLDLLEAIFIRSFSPSLCQQKAHVRTLHLL